MMTTHPVPHRVDDPPRAGPFDADVFAVSMSGLVIAIVTKVFWIPVLSGLSMGWLFNRFKSGRHSAYILDFAYWYFPPSASLPGRLPPGCIRRFEQ